MTRINVIVEGPTEESFIKDVLAPSLWSHSIYVTPIVLGVPGQKGGNVSYPRVKKDVLLQLRQDKNVYCSTMFDLYGLKREFPGEPPPPHSSGSEKASRIEQGMLANIVEEIPDLRADIRFIPNLLVHEYEGLLFSDPTAFARALRREDLSESLRRIRSNFPTPEDINEGPETAPSKQVLSLYPGYKKVIEGTLAARAIGINSMRQECSHFDGWLSRLEALAPLG